ncbi:uncharacterized protein LOC118593284 [Onychomys torridus]|uniref:uncharacterized protein LOC118593284 n=1 Tax=Onychomys torridus TaxID=38674 RepID=UPI00167F9340|nr:uncharacterized protein LOC118593284 [Onychomys torridus]
MSEYKTIVLQQGLEDVAVDDYQFRKIKSLLRQELNLTKKMQDEYDKIQIADLMEDIFPKDAGLNKLIEVCQRIKELENLAKRLKTERAKVKGKTPLRKRKQEAGSDTPTSTTSNPATSDGGETSTAQKRKSINKGKTGAKMTKQSEGPDHPPCPEEATASCQSPVLQVSSSASSNTPLAKNQKTQIQTQSITRGAVLQKDDMTVMVLNAIDPFEYESSEGKKMFHATVVTVNEYFHVKVFNINLKEKFTKMNIIVISNFIKFKGILEINEASTVCDAGPNQKIEVPKCLIKTANETPNISHIRNGVAGTVFYGLFILHKKTVYPKNTIYEVEDNSGKIEVVGNGKWYNINCDEGDKLQLFCFQLKTINKQPKLVCGDHSFIKVTKARRKKKIPTTHLNPKDEGESSYLLNQFSAFNSDFFKIEPPSNCSRILLYACYFACEELLIQTIKIGKALEVNPVAAKLSILKGLFIIVEIMSEYKTIVLQQGLEDVAVDDYQFRKIKSLLRKKLNLTKMMQDEYDRIQIADLMEDTFPKDAGLNLLINVCKSIKELEDLAKRLKTERAKVCVIRGLRQGCTGLKRCSQDGEAESTTPGKGKESSEVVPVPDLVPLVAFWPMKKRKQEEPSSSRSLSTDNESAMSKPSSEKKRKQTTKTEGGKKRKLTQKQTQFLESSGCNPQKDECCLQTPQKPPPTPSSSSSNKSTIETHVSQKKHQLLEFSATSNFSAASKFQTLPEVAAAAASPNNLQTSQRPVGTCFTLKMSSGSPAPLCQNFPMSPASDSSIHLNSPVPLTLSSGVQAPDVPPATISGNSWVPHMPSETLSSSFSAPQMSPVSVSSSAQNIHIPTAATAKSKQSLHSPQVTTSRPAQTPKGPSATLKSEAQSRTMTPAIASSNIEAPHALPEAVSRNDSTTHTSQRATSSGTQTLNSATVRAPRNANVPGPLGTGHVCFLASSASPATASSSLQTSQVCLPTTCNSLSAPQVSIPIGTSRAQTTQTHTGAPSNVHAPQLPSATTLESLLALCGSPPKASSRLLDPRVFPAMASSALQAPLVPPETVSSSLSKTPKKGNLPKEPSKVEGHHRVPKEVVVLKVTEPFTYDLIDDKRMFHATVATETEFFRVKVFDTALKNKFIPQKIIAISDYFGANGFLEIYGASCVSDVNVNQMMVISNTLRRRANGTPKIKDLFSQEKGTYVNGEFVVTKKNERGDFIYYGIEDDTGKMEVVVYGRLTSIKCEPGNKLRLVCFELTSREDTWQLKSVRHSYMQVIIARRRGTQP